MTEITEEAVDEENFLRALSIILKSPEKRIKLEELCLPDELLHTTSMDIKVGIQNVAKKDFGSKKWTIYRVDQNLKKLHDETTFHPKLISIGPFHHNKSDHLKPMEDHKWRFLSRFLNSIKPYSHNDYYHEIRRSSSTTTADYTDQTSMKIQVLVAKMEKLENKARACYSETFDDLGSKEFVMMMVLDGCFIIELLILFDKSKGRCRNGDDPIFTSRSVLPNLMHDLLLLENQLPFQVLEEILKLKVVLGRKYKLTDLILNFFNTMLFRESKVLDACSQAIIQIPDHHHLLASFRSSFQTEKADHPSVQQPNPIVLFSRNLFKRILFWRNLNFLRNRNDGEESDDQCDWRFGTIKGERERTLTTLSDNTKGERERTLTTRERTLTTLSDNTKGERELPLTTLSDRQSKRVITKLAMKSIQERTLTTVSDQRSDRVITKSATSGERERTLTTVSDRRPIQTVVRIKGTQDIELKHMSIHCVAELREAGVEFKKRSCHHDLLDIEFKKGKLYIPTLYINDSTSSVFLNFIAYEQRNHSVKPNFTSYLMFLDSLVNSSKDVEHLRHKRIIDHGLGSYEEVATMFHKICKDVVQDFGDDNYLSQVFKEVNKYFGKRRNRWRAAWKHEYFRNPWAFSSFLAAIILLVLTFLQAFFSIYAYFHPPS